MRDLDHPSAIATAGIGTRTTSHLNLMRSFEADVTAHYREVQVRLRPPVLRGVNRALIPPAPSAPIPVLLPPPVRDVLMPGKRRTHVNTVNNDPRAIGIVAQVAQKHGFTVQQIISARRQRQLVEARHEAMWRLSRETSMSLPAIGRKLGGKDHTTVLYGIRKHEERMRAQA